MKISLNWLEDFISVTQKDHEKIKEVVTANTAEVETMERQGEHLDNVVVGKIIELKKHPNADALRLAVVNDGTENSRVVCGGSNLRENMLVAFARIGAVVRWHGTEVVKLEKAKIRGEESFGMICSSEEIGLDEMFPRKSEKEIVDLTSLDLQVGAPLGEALGLKDTVLHVDNHALTNRADLFSHRGFAREFVANGLGKWKKLKTFKMPVNNSPCPITIDIKDKEVCSRYAAVYITGIEIADSPDWMKKRLSACGVRPICNIVDVTNYVMLELGMPLHAFDLDQVKSKKWTMRKSRKGEKVVTLDEKEHELFDDVIIMDDGNEIFDLCGIMGGFTSGVRATTNRVLFHSPVYNPTLVRRAMRGLGHVSDAGIIYEKGVDNELAKEGLLRAVQLILEICPNAKVASKVVEIQNTKTEKRELKLRDSHIQRLVGIAIKPAQVTKILKDLGFKVLKQKGGFKVGVPSWRLGDVTREADLVEEIARIYGYDNIPVTTPSTEIGPIATDRRRDLEKRIKNQLTSFGFDEIYTYAFLGPEILAKCGMKADAETIEVSNPISSDMSLMRQSLLPRVLENIAQNLRYQDKIRVFELNPTYHKTGENRHDERGTVLMATAGEDFRNLQGVIENLGCKISPSKPDAPYRHPGRMGELIVRGHRVGYIYEVHPQMLKNFDIKTRVTVVELELEAIHAMNLERWPSYQELPKFPSVKLDVSLLIPKKNLAADYFKAIESTDKNLIRNVELVDEYVGDKIAPDKRSLTYSITYQAVDRTLTEQEVNAIHQQVINKLKTTGAEIR